MEKPVFVLKMLSLLLFMVNIRPVLADEPFECRETYTISEQSPILVWHTDDVARYTRQPESGRSLRFCVTVACQDCTVLIEYTRTCKVQPRKDQCLDETRIWLNKGELPRSTCESGYKDASNDTFLDVCTYEVTGDFSFVYFDSSFEENNFIAGAISFQVDEWLLNGYDYVLKPIDVKPAAQDFVLIDDSPRPTWLILTLGEVNPNYFEELTLTPGCDYDLIIGAPPGQGNPDYSKRRLMTFRKVPAEDYVKQYFDSSIYSLLIPPECPGRIDLYSTNSYIYGDQVQIEICDGETFLVSAGTATSTYEALYLPTLWRRFSCHDSLINVTIEFNTYLDGHLIMRSYDAFGNEYVDRKFELTEQIAQPFNLSVLNIGSVWITWSPGVGRDGLLARVHVVRDGPIPVAPTGETTKSTTTMATTTTTRIRQTTRLEATTSVTSQVTNLLYNLVAAILLVALSD